MLFVLVAQFRHEGTTKLSLWVAQYQHEGTTILPA